MADALRVADQAQHRRPDNHAGKQIAQHRPQLQALGQRNGEHRREQKHDSGLQQVAFMGHGENSRTRYGGGHKDKGCDGRRQPGWQ
ncbi:hypothetical protein D9M69_725540 [compost metagenome]